MHQYTYVQILRTKLDAHVDCTQTHQKYLHRLRGTADKVWNRQMSHSVLTIIKKALRNHSLFHFAHVYNCKRYPQCGISLVVLLPLVQQPVSVRNWLTKVLFFQVSSNVGQ